eukprot:14464670-Alexandrium_andersonii.AAC.1
MGGVPPPSRARRVAGGAVRCLGATSPLHRSRKGRGRCAGRAGRASWGGWGDWPGAGRRMADPGRPA